MQKGECPIIIVCQQVLHYERMIFGVKQLGMFLLLVISSLVFSFSIGDHHSLTVQFPSCLIPSLYNMIMNGFWIIIIIIIFYCNRHDPYAADNEKGGTNDAATNADKARSLLELARHQNVGGRAAGNDDFARKMFLGLKGGKKRLGDDPNSNSGNVLSEELQMRLNEESSSSEEEFVTVNEEDEDHKEKEDESKQKKIKKKSHHKHEKKRKKKHRKHRSDSKRRKYESTSDDSSSSNSSNSSSDSDDESSHDRHKHRKKKSDRRKRRKRSRSDKHRKRK